MPNEGSITQWVAQLKGGDSVAPVKLWNRYYHRLVGLARKKLRDVSRRVSDEEDVVVDAFNSFCRGAEDGRFPKLDDRDDLWQILMMLTVRKAANQVKHDLRQKRGGGQVRGESVFLQVSDEQEKAAIDLVVGSEPSPQFAADIAEQCEELLLKLGDESLANVAIAKMEGYTNNEIARNMGVQTRTVERKLRIIRELWAEDF